MTSRLPMSNTIEWYGGKIERFNGPAFHGGYIAARLDEPLLLLGVAVIADERYDGNLGTLYINDLAANRTIFECPVASLARRYRSFMNAEQYFNSKPLWFLADALMSQCEKQPAVESVKALRTYVEGLRLEMARFMSESGISVIEPYPLMPGVTIELRGDGGALPYEVELTFVIGRQAIGRILRPEREVGGIDASGLELRIGELERELEELRERMAWPGVIPGQGPVPGPESMPWIPDPELPRGEEPIWDEPVIERDGEWLDQFRDMIPWERQRLVPRTPPLPRVPRGPLPRPRGPRRR